MIPDTLQFLSHNYTKIASNNIRSQSLLNSVNSGRGIRTDSIRQTYINIIHNTDNLNVLTIIGYHIVFRSCLKCKSCFRLRIREKKTAIPDNFYTLKQKTVETTHLERKTEAITHPSLVLNKALNFGLCNTSYLWKRTKHGVENKKLRFKNLCRPNKSVAWMPR